MKIVVPERLDDNYARAPMPNAVPTKPDADSFATGVEPLDTCPASYWNWFMRTLFVHGALTTDAIQSLYDELCAVLAEAGIEPDEASPAQVPQAVKVIIQVGVAALANRVTTLETATIPTLANRVTTAEGKIPNQASASNQLADKDFVNSSIINMAARYITPDAAGNNQWTSLQALRDGPWYTGGALTTPTQNDYAIFTNTDNSTWRAIFSSSLWSPAYKVNDTPFTAAQVAALNSNITATLVAKIVNPDTTPTQNSQELVTSGGVWSWFINKLAVDENRVKALEDIVLGLFVAVGDSNKIAYSTDGINWTTVAVGSGYWYAITYANGLFVAVGSSKIAYSTDGINWTTVAVGSSAWGAITYANGLFVAVGDDGTIAYSTNGIAWTTVAVGSGYWYAITYAGNLAERVAALEALQRGA